VQSSPAKLALIPPHKSLWTQPAHLGLPIGNLSSQFFANVC
jgi:RNA-directed DNA polymerase